MKISIKELKQTISEVLVEGESAHCECPECEQMIKRDLTRDVRGGHDYALCKKCRSAGCSSSHCSCQKKMAEGLEEGFDNIDPSWKQFVKKMVAKHRGNRALLRSAINNAAKKHGLTEHETYGLQDYATRLLGDEDLPSPDHSFAGEDIHAQHDREQARLKKKVK